MDISYKLNKLIHIMPVAEVIFILEIFVSQLFTEKKEFFKINAGFLLHYIAHNLLH